MAADVHGMGRSGGGGVLMSAAYRPGVVPTNPADIPAYLQQELASIVRAWVSAEDVLSLKVLHKEPERLPQDSVTLCIADGVNWNPGAGAGLYRRQGGTWTKVG